MIDVGFNSLFLFGGGFIFGGIVIIGDWIIIGNVVVLDLLDDWNVGEGISIVEGNGDDVDLILDIILGEMVFVDVVCKFREGIYFKMVEGGIR